MVASGLPSLVEKAPEATDSDMSDLFRRYVEQQEIPENPTTTALIGFLKGVKDPLEAQIKVDEEIKHIADVDGTNAYSPITHILETKQATDNDRFLLMATILRATPGASGLIQDEDDVVGMRFENTEDDERGDDFVLAVYGNLEKQKMGTAGTIYDFYPPVYENMNELLLKNIRARNWMGAKVSVIQFRKEDLNRVLESNGSISLIEEELVELDHAKIYGFYIFNEETPFGPIKVFTTENSSVSGFGFGIETLNSAYIYEEDIGDLGKVIRDYFVYYKPSRPVDTKYLDALSDDCNSIGFDESEYSDCLEVYMVSKNDAVTEHTVSCSYKIIDGNLELFHIYESIKETISEKDRQEKMRGSLYIRKVKGIRGKKVTFKTFDGAVLDEEKVEDYDFLARHVLNEINIDRFIDRFHEEQRDGTYKLIIPSIS